MPTETTSESSQSFAEALAELERVSSLTSDRAEALKQRLLQIESVLQRTTTRVIATAQRELASGEVLFVRYARAKGSWQFIAHVADKGVEPPKLNDEWLILTDAPLWIRAASVDCLPEIIERQCKAQQRQLGLVEGALEKLDTQIPSKRRKKEGA